MGKGKDSTTSAKDLKTELIEAVAPKVLIVLTKVSLLEPNIRTGGTVKFRITSKFHRLATAICRGWD